MVSSHGPGRPTLLGCQKVAASLAAPLCRSCSSKDGRKVGDRKIFLPSQLFAKHSSASGLLTQATTQGTQPCRRRTSDRPKNDDLLVPQQALHNLSGLQIMAIVASTVTSRSSGVSHSGSSSAQIGQQDQSLFSPVKLPNSLEWVGTYEAAGPGSFCGRPTNHLASQIKKFRPRVQRWFLLESRPNSNRSESCAGSSKLGPPRR